MFYLKRLFASLIVLLPIFLSAQTDTVFYKSGKIQTITIKKDDKTISKTHGKHILNFEDGKPQLTGSYQDNQKDGLWTEYFPNGSKKSEVNYKEGARTGKCVYWNKDGLKGGEYNYAT